MRLAYALLYTSLCVNRTYFMCIQHNVTLCKVLVRIIYTELLTHEKKTVKVFHPFLMGMFLSLHILQEVNNDLF